MEAIGSTRKHLAVLGRNPKEGKHLETLGSTWKEPQGREAIGISKYWEALQMTRKHQEALGSSWKH